jgi:hypothetical protein
MIGSLHIHDLRRSLLTMIDIYGLDNLPKVLIVGTKKLNETELRTLIVNATLENKVYYLSVPNGIDRVAFEKANVSKCNGLFFFSRIAVDSN